MATTTNYNWSTPDDTSLVKDGAAAIRTLGSSIDTTTKALNPSTTLGDIEYRSSTANTNTRLGIGSSGQVLTVAAGVPSWATPSAPTPTAVGASAYNSTGQSLSAYTLTALSLNTENYDTNTFHDNSTNNSRMTIPTGYAGKYRVSATISLTPSGDITTHLYKNGSAVALGTNAGQISRIANVAVQLTYNVNFDIDLAVGDYVQVVVNPGAGGITTVSQVVSIAYIGA